MEFHSENDWHRLVQYLTGECTSEEEGELQRWIVEDRRRARLMDELRQIWDATGKNLETRDVDAGWKRLQEKLQNEKHLDDSHSEDLTDEGQQSNQGSRTNLPSTTHGRFSLQGYPFQRGALIGALVLFVGLMSLLFVKEGWPGSSSAEEKAFRTKKGQRASIHLSDGTTVRLNADSRLVVTETFTTGKREVRLDGEAYFEVTKDDRPFIVHSGGAEVEVLGTAFDVKAYGESEDVQVTVSKGTVALRSEGGGTRDTLQLNARQLGVVSGRHLQAVREGVDLSKQLAWMNGKLVFNDASLTEVVRKLERWYDLQIKTTVASESVDRLNATFDEESPEEALVAIAAALDLRYKHDGETVVLYRAEKMSSR